MKKIGEAGIPTLFVSSDRNNALMTVKNAHMFGHGLEVICRYRAAGSFLLRYEAYCNEHDPLDGIIEITVKDDERQDPPISKDTLLH